MFATCFTHELNATSKYELKLVVTQIGFREKEIVAWMYITL